MEMTNANALACEKAVHSRCTPAMAAEMGTAKITMKLATMLLKPSARYYLMPALKTGCQQYPPEKARHNIHLVT